MTEYSFSLIPFPDTKTPEIKITGKVTRQDNQLAVHLLLTGEIEKILFPEPSTHPARTDELWKATCFEFFLALPNEAPYWEFNLSSSGDWNVYRMDAYRRLGFREETSIQRLPFSIEIEAGCVSLDAQVDLSPILREEHPIQVGITSVIQTRDGNETYWALTHPNLQADFHLRESFTVGI